MSSARFRSSGPAVHQIDDGLAVRANLDQVLGGLYHPFEALQRCVSNRRGVCQDRSEKALDVPTNGGGRVAPVARQEIGVAKDPRGIGSRGHRAPLTQAIQSNLHQAVFDRRSCGLQSGADLAGGEILRSVIDDSSTSMIAMYWSDSCTTR